MWILRFILRVIQCPLKTIQLYINFGRFLWNQRYFSFQLRSTDDLLCHSSLSFQRFSFQKLPTSRQIAHTQPRRLISKALLTLLQLFQSAPSAFSIQLFYHFIKEVFCVHQFNDNFMYNYPIMNNRQIELQVIIRNLQNKILIQKEEAKILSDHFEQRLKQTEQECKNRLIQKERMIQYLTLELDKDRQIIMNQQYVYDSKRVRERDQLYAQCERLKVKNTDMEKKLQGMIQRYELEKRDLENEIKKYQEKQYDQSFSRASIQGEIEKLNKFYHQSRVDQPKRKDLVEWTEKLSALITKTQKQNKNAQQELFTFIKNNLQAFKTELMQSLANASQFEQQILKNKKEILNNIKAIVNQEIKSKNQMVEINEKLYQILKKEKHSAQSQKITQLQRQLNQTRKKSGEVNQQLINRIKALQNQRKTLLLGFTQLKTLNQTRQKTYKQQISALKQTIQSLLSTGQQRQYEFQKQMKVLHGQLTSISERYYENIEVPLSKISSKLDGQIKVARSELQKLADNRVFLRAINDLEQVMQAYVAQNANSSKINHQICQYAKKTEDMANWAQKICRDQHDRQLLAKQIEKQEVVSQKNSMDTLHGKMNSIQTNIRQIQWKEKQNKLLYELNTAKKLYKKMKDYCTTLQQKINNSDNNRSVSPIKKGRVASSNVKNIHPSPSSIKITENPIKNYQLEAEVQRLTLMNKSFSEEYLYQLSVIKNHLQKISGKQIKDQKNLFMLQRGIYQIAEFNEKMRSLVQRQNTHMASIREILSTLNKMLIKPVQIFDNFVEKLTNCYKNPSLSPNKLSAQFYESKTSNIFSHLQKVYRQTYTKRQENNNQASRLMVDFIKLLRQTTPNHPKNSLKTIPNLQNEKQTLQKSRIGTRQSGVQKKIRDLQNMRIKSREETIKKMQRIQDILRNIQTKYSKRHFVSLNRLQESITRKIDQIRDKCMQRLKQDNSEINELTGTVLKDIKNKLKMCMNQNQGLVKQVQLLQKLKKKQ